MDAKEQGDHVAVAVVESELTTVLTSHLKISMTGGAIAPLRKRPRMKSYVVLKFMDKVLNLLTGNGLVQFHQKDVDIMPLEDSMLVANKRRLVWLQTKHQSCKQCNDSWKFRRMLVD